MSTYNAMMQIQVDTSDANKKLTEVDRNLSSIRSTSSETSSSLKRMEGTFARIEKTMRSVERTMKGVHQVMKYMARANASMGNSFKGLGKDISDINSKFNKFSSNISNISSKYATLKKQNKNLSDQINKLKQDMKALGSATGGAGTKTKETGGAFEKLTKVLKENSYWVGSLVSGFLSLISIELASHFVRITDQLTLMKNRLGTVNPEVVKLEENFDSVVQIAMETRSNLAAVANLYSRIGRNSKRLQKDQEALVRVVRTINQGFQLSGATAEEARNAIVQLSQAFASGRLQGDELRSVLELAPEAAKGLAKAIGITTGTMRRFASEGMITTEVMVAAFEKASAETQAKFDKIKATISQAMENVRTAIYAGIEGAEGFGNANQLIANKIMSLANIIKNAKDQFSFIGRIVENVALNFEKFAVGITAVVAVLGGMLIISTLSALFTSFGAVIGLSGGAVLGLVTAIGLLTYKLIDIAVEIKTTAEQLRPLDEVIKELSDSTKTGMDRLNGYRDELSKTQLASNELEVQLKVINTRIKELDESIKNARGTWREYADDLLGFVQDWKIFGLDLILPGSDKQELAELTKRAAKLEKLQTDMTERTAKLREQEKKAMEEVKKDTKEVDPQALLLKEVYAKQAAFARQMELVGEALSNEFIQGFTNPFDSGLGGLQSALTRFTENVASKTASLFKSKLPEGIPLFDPKVLVKQASSFNQAIEEGLRSGKRVSLFGMPDENGVRQLTQEYKNIINSILSDPSTQAAFKEQDTLGKIMQAEMDSILRAQLIDLEKAINQYIIQQNQKIKTEERSLKAQREQLELTEFSAKAEMDGLKKNTPLLKVQESIIEEEYRIRLLNYEQKLKDLNITGKAKNALMEELALQKDLAISLEKVNQEKSLYLDLQKKQNDLLSQTERVADLQFELDHLIKGTKELDKQKLLNETIIAKEKVILDQRREREGLTDEQYRQELAILETKKSLLDLEADITEEIRKQNELRKTEDELARARLLDQAKTQAQQMKGQLSLFQQLGIGLGLVKDPTKDFVDRQEAFIDATIASGKKVSDLYMGRGGTGLQINPAVQRDMDETAMNIIKNRMELFEEKSKTTPLNNNLATRLLGQSKFIPQDIEYPLQRKKGGMIQGPSHAKGGVKGFLYGQPIELEGGEYVISKDAVAKYGIPLFEGLNAKKFQNGGPTVEQLYAQGNKAMQAGDMVLYNKILKTIDDRVRRDKAQEYAKKGVPTFFADGTSVGDTTKLVEKEEKRLKVVQDVTDSSEKLKETTDQFNQNLLASVEVTKKSDEVRNTELEMLQRAGKVKTTAEMEAAEAIKKVTETYRDSARDWREAYAEAEMRMGPQTGLLGGGITGKAAAGIGVVFADALGKSGAFKTFTEDILKLAINPVEGVTQILSRSLLENEKFQQALQRFLDIFYVMFDEMAEGFAIFFEAIVDLINPLKPLLRSLGSAFKGIMRALTQVIQPFAKLVEALQPVIIYLNAFLQLFVGMFAEIVGGLADFLDSAITGILSPFIDDTTGYKSLNILRQERDLFTEINSLFSSLQTTVESIRDVVYEIMNSTLNISAEGIKLELATEKYNELFRAATEIADEASITEFQDFAKGYLQQAQDVLKTSNAYQQVFIGVIEDLESLQLSMTDGEEYAFTAALKQAIFDLRVAGSNMADELVSAVDAYQTGTLSFTDLATYVNFKLSQIEQDIDMKEMSEFGAIGDYTKVKAAYDEYLSSEMGAFYDRMGNAISESKFSEDIELLFGITTTGERAEGAVTKEVTVDGTTYQVPVGIVESEAAYAKATGRSLSRQPVIGEISKPPAIDDERKGETDSFGFGLDLAELLSKFAQAIYDALLAALKGILTTAAEFLKALFSFIEKLAITIADFLGELLGWIGKLGITVADFLGELLGWIDDLVITAATFLDEIFGWIDDLTIEVSDFLGEIFGWIDDLTIEVSDFLDEIFGWIDDFTIEVSDFLDEIFGWIDDLTITATDLLDEIFGWIDDLTIGVSDFLDEVFGWIGDLSITASDVLTKFFGELFTGTRTAFEAITDFFSNIISGADRSPLQAIGDFFSEVLTGSDALSPIQALISFFSNIFKGGGQLDPGQVLTQLFNQIFGTSTTDAAGAIKSFIEAALSGTTDAATAIKSMVEAMINGFANAADAIVDIIEGLVGGGVASAQDFIDALFGQAESLLNELFLFKNPFHQFGMGPEYLLKFESGGQVESFANGGMLNGPSHDNGGIKAIVGGKKPVELEGGEFIINKESTKFLGLDFLNMVNSVSGKEDLIRRNIGSQNALGTLKFANGGEIDPRDQGDPGLLRGYYSKGRDVGRKDLLGFLQGLGGAAIDSVGNLVGGIGGPKIKTNKNKGAGASMSSGDPGKLIEPTDLLPDMRFFNVDWQTADWIEPLLGEHRFKMDLGFPENNEFDIYEGGGSVDHAIGGKRRTAGSMLEPSVHRNDLKYTIAKDKLDVGKSYLEDTLGLPSGDISSFLSSALSQGFELVQNTIDLFGSFGGLLTNRFTSFVPLGGLEFDAKESNFQTSDLEFYVGMAALVSLMLWVMETASRGDFSKGSSFLKNVPISMRDLGVNTKNPFFDEFPLWPLIAFPAMNIFQPKGYPEQVSLLDLLQYHLSKPFNNDDERAGESGTTALGFLSQIVNALTLGGIEANRGERLIEDTMLAMGIYLFSSGKGFSGLADRDPGSYRVGGIIPSYGNGGELAAAGGMASGPLHQSGMLGMTKQGSPFLFEGGEYIVSRRATEKIGVANLDKMNQMGSGGALPEFGDRDSGILPEYWSKGYSDNSGPSFPERVGIYIKESYGWLANYLSGDASKNKKMSNKEQLARGLTVGFSLPIFAMMFGQIFSNKGDGGIIPEFENRGVVNLDWVNSWTGSNASSSSSFFDIESILTGIAIILALKMLYDRFFNTEEEEKELLETISKSPGPSIPSIFNDEDFLRTFAGLQKYKLDPETQWRFSNELDGGIVENLAFVSSSTAFSGNGLASLLGTGMHGDVSDFYSYVLDSGISSLPIGENLFVIPSSAPLRRSVVTGSEFGVADFSDEIRSYRKDLAISSWIAANYINDNDIAGSYTDVFDPSSNFHLTRRESTKQFVDDPGVYYTGFIAFGAPTSEFEKYPTRGDAWEAITMGYVNEYAGYRGFTGNLFSENQKTQYIDWRKQKDPELWEFGSGGQLQAGGIAKGPSHQSGMIGYAKGGSPFLFEGGEYIINKRATANIGVDRLDKLNSMGSGGTLPEFGSNDGYIDMDFNPTIREARIAVKKSLKARAMKPQQQKENFMFVSDLLAAGGATAALMAALVSGAYANMALGDPLAGLFGNQREDYEPTIFERLALLAGAAGAGYLSSFFFNYSGAADKWDKFGSGGSLPEFGDRGHVGRGVYKKGGAGFSYEDIGGFFSMLASPFVSIYEFIASLFESKPRRSGFPRFGEKGTGGILPEHGTGVYKEGGAGFSYEDIGNFFSMLASPFVSVYEFFASLFSSKGSKKRKYGFPRFGEKGIGGTIPEFGVGGGAGFSYEDIGSFFSMLASPFVSVYNFLFGDEGFLTSSWKPFRRGRDGSYFGSGGSLPEFAGGGLGMKAGSPEYKKYKQREDLYRNLFILGALPGLAISLDEMFELGLLDDFTDNQKQAAFAGGMSFSFLTSAIKSAEEGDDIGTFAMLLGGLMTGSVALDALSGSRKKFKGYGSGGALPEFGKGVNLPLEALITLGASAGFFGLNFMSGREGVRGTREGKKLERYAELMVALSIFSMGNLARRKEPESGFGPLMMAIGAGKGIDTLYELGYFGEYGSGGALPEFGKGANIPLELLIALGAGAGAFGLNIIAGREGVKGTREGARLDRYTELMVALSLFSMGNLGRRKQPESGFGPLMMLFGATSGYDSLSRLGYLGGDGSGILPDYKEYEYGSGGALPEFKKGDILPDHYLGLSGRFAGSRKDTPKFSKNDPFVKMAKSSLKNAPGPLAPLFAGASLGSRYILGPAALALLAAELLNPDNNDYLDTPESKLFFLTAGSELALYPTEGYSRLGPFPRTAALGYGAYQLSSVPMLLQVLGDDKQDDRLRAFAALSLYPAIAGGYEFSKIGVTGKFEWPKLVSEYADWGFPESTSPNDGFFETTKKTGQVLFVFAKGLASFIGPLIIANALEKQKKAKNSEMGSGGPIPSFAGGGDLTTLGILSLLYGATADDKSSHKRARRADRYGGLGFLLLGLETARKNKDQGSMLAALLLSGYGLPMLLSSFSSKSPYGKQFYAMGSGGTLPEFGGEQGFLADIFAQDRRSSAFDKGLFEIGASRDVSRSRVIKGRGKRDDSWGFWDYAGAGSLGLLLYLAAMNNFGSGGALPEFAGGGGILSLLLGTLAGVKMSDTFTARLGKRGDSSVLSAAMAMAFSGMSGGSSSHVLGSTLGAALLGYLFGGGEYPKDSWLAKRNYGSGGALPEFGYGGNQALIGSGSALLGFSILSAFPRLMAAENQRERDKISRNIFTTSFAGVGLGALGMSQGRDTSEQERLELILGGLGSLGLAAWLGGLFDRRRGPTSQSLRLTERNFGKGGALPEAGMGGGLAMLLGLIFGDYSGRGYADSRKNPPPPGKNNYLFDYLLAAIPGSIFGYNAALSFGRGGALPEAGMGGGLALLLGLLFGADAGKGFAERRQYAPPPADNNYLLDFLMAGIPAGILGYNLGLSFGSGGALPKFDKGGLGDPGSERYKNYKKREDFYRKLFLLGAIPFFALIADEQYELGLFDSFFDNKRQKMSTAAGFLSFSFLSSALKNSEEGNQIGTMFSLIGALMLGGSALDAGFGQGFNKKYASGGSLQAGGMAKGPSHQSGMIGYAQGGGPFLFEGGEYIINKRSSEAIGIENLNKLNSMGKGGKLPMFVSGGQPLFANRALMDVGDTYGPDGKTKGFVYSSGLTGGGDVDSMYYAFSQALASTPIVIAAFDSMAFEQLYVANLMAIHAGQGQKTLEDLLLEIALTAGLSSYGRYKGMSPEMASAFGAEGAGFALMARSTAEDDQKDIAMAASLASSMLLAGTGWGPIVAIIAGTYFGDRDRYLADFNMGAQEAVQEPFQGFWDEVAGGNLYKGLVEYQADALNDLSMRLSNAFKKMGEGLTEILTEKWGIYGDNFKQFFDQLDSIAEIEDLIYYMRDTVLEFFKSLPNALAEEFGKQDTELKRLAFAIIALPIFVMGKIGETLIKYIENPEGLSKLAFGFLTSLTEVVKFIYLPLSTLIQNPSLVFGVAQEFLISLAKTLSVIPNAIIQYIIENPDTLASQLIKTGAMVFAGIPSAIISYITEDPAELGRAIINFGASVINSIPQSVTDYITSEEGMLTLVGVAIVVALVGIIPAFLIAVGLWLVENGVGQVALTLLDETVKSIRKMFEGVKPGSLAQWLIDFLKDLAGSIFGTGGGGGLFGRGGFLGTGLGGGGGFLGTGIGGGGGLLSDENLKSNRKLVGVNSQGLGVYGWDWNQNAKALGIKDRSGYGVIAQEVMKSIPNAVSEIGGYLAVDYNQIDLKNIGTAGFMGLSYLNSEETGSSVSGSSLSFRSGSSEITSEISNSSSMNNQLLQKLISVLEDKEMSVTVVDSDGNQKTSSNIRISKQKEMEYRNARELA